MNLFRIVTNMMIINDNIDLANFGSINHINNAVSTDNKITNLRPISNWKPNILVGVTCVFTLSAAASIVLEALSVASVKQEQNLSTYI